MFRKTGLIIRREYLTRVRNRSFILSTLLLPLVLIGFVFATAYFSSKSSEKQKIAIDDQNGIFQSAFRSDASLQFDFTKDINSNNFLDRGYNAYLHIPSDFSANNDSITLISAKQLSLQTEDKIKNQLNEALRIRALVEHHIDKKLLDSINSVKQDNLYKFIPIVRQGQKSTHSNAELSYAIGFGSGFLIYLTLLIYGTSVMRGVMEEKTNRIAEVIISSVRPFQLMTGKIIGIAAVGLTQLLIWFLLIIVLLFGASLLLSPATLQHTQSLQTAMATNQENASAAIQILAAKNTFLSANWGLILPCFLFYFLGGYLFYASLFAAVGSVVNEDAQEAQSLVLPITMPIILSFIIMTTAITNPESPIAVWSSIIPLSSPIVMMARIPSGNVALWELGLSVILLIGGFIFTTYIAAKIYRTGILLYGKKVTLKEIGKWLVRKT